MQIAVRSCQIKTKDALLRAFRESTEDDSYLSLILF